MDAKGRAGEQVFTLFLLFNLGMSCRGSTEDKPLPLAQMEFIFTSLRTAEENYVKFVYGDRPPVKYTNKTLELIPGVSLSTNSTDILESFCTIFQCINQTLPDIVKTCTQKHQSILGNLTEVEYIFTQALKASHKEPCQRRHFDVPRTKYKRKEFGLKILSSTREWLEYLTNTTDVN